MKPPEKDEGRAHVPADTTTNNTDPHHQTGGYSHCKASPRLCESDTRPWHRRRQASYRLPPLDCGCRDPWPCRCIKPPLTEKMIDAGRDAALRLLAEGHIPLLAIEVRRALWRRGGADRVLAQLLHELCGEMAA